MIYVWVVSVYEGCIAGVGGVSVAHLDDCIFNLQFT